MTHSETLVKLLAIEPQTEFQLGVITGWGQEEASSVLRGLLESGKVGYVNGPGGKAGARRYCPQSVPQRDAGLLPVALGASRKPVRNARSGLVRGTGPGLAGWSWPANPQRSGEEASCNEGGR